MPAQHSVDLLFDPVFDLKACGGATESPLEFESCGDDPQFEVRAHPGLAAITPGWWRIRGWLDASDGWIITPRFYADHGDGYNERDCIPLCEPSPRGRIDTVLFIKAPLCRLRFDPTIREARFRIEGMSLSPLSRPGAVVRMLHGIGSGLFGSWRQMFAAAANLLRDCVLATPARGAQSLLHQYLRAHALPETGYDVWYRRFDALRSDLVASATRGMDEIDSPPDIAILLAVANPRIDLLRRCLDGVVAQTWPRWRLRVSVARGTSAAAQALLQGYASVEPRITLSAAPPEGLLAGVLERYAGFLEQDAVLAPNALCEFAYAIDAHPAAGLFYSDSDRVNADGRRLDPCFKPNWNPQLLLAQDYVGHMTVVRTTILRAAGDMRMDTAGWHHDLVLRCTHRLQSSQIRHVPKVLYHAACEDQSSSPQVANRHAVEAHLQRNSARANVARLADGQLRVTPVLPDPQPTVTIIVPTRDRVALLRSCIDSVLVRTRYERFEILIVDNGSVESATLDYLDQLRQHPRCRVLAHPAPFNFSAIVNAGARIATGDILCLLNNDIEAIGADWLAEMVAYAAQSDVGAVGAMLYYPDDTIQHGGVMLGIGGVAGHIYHRCSRGCAGHQGRARVAQDMSAVTGACLVVRRSVFAEVGGFDESLAVAFNDIDFCLRLLRAGYRNLWTPHAELYHHESVSRGHEDTPEKRSRFAAEVKCMVSRWGDFLKDDPAYNPNLTLDWSQFQLAFPPRIGALDIYRQSPGAGSGESDEGKAAGICDDTLSARF